MQDTLQFIFLASGGLGLFLFYIGWYRRRYDGGSYCRKCGYRVDQSGDAVVRCSECGTDLQGTGRVLPYQRYRSPIAIAVGLILLAFGTLAVVTDAARGISSGDFYRLLPTWYLLRTDVSANGDFGNEPVQVLRMRVLDDSLNEIQLRRFTELLCKRAINLHRNLPDGRMQYTGMTLNLLKDFKPNDESTNALLKEVFSNILQINAGGAVIDHDGRLRILIPEVKLDPQYPFLHVGDIASVRLRNEIKSVTIIQGNAEVKPTSVYLISPWRGLFPPDDLDMDKPMQLSLTINWYIENATLTFPINGSNGNDDVTTTKPPWHTTTYTGELRPVADSNSILEFGHLPGAADEADTPGARFKLIPNPVMD